MESFPAGNSFRVDRPSAIPPGLCDTPRPDLRGLDAANDMGMSRLARTIEEQIIPRLMLAHRALAELPVAPPLDLEIGADDVKRFARQTLSLDEDEAGAAVHVMRARGVPIERIYLDLLAPTARYLGDLWNDDLCTFTDVTVALGRLQRVLRELSPALGHGVCHAAEGRRVLLAPCPGEQHTFGLGMVSDFFRLAGWDVSCGGWGGAEDAVSVVSSAWFDVVGFSLGGKVHIDVLKREIAAVRRAACNRRIAVIVGGPLFLERPDLADQLGADAVATDGRAAPVLSEALVARVAATPNLAAGNPSDASATG